MKLFEIILEIFGWLQIVVGVTLAAGLFALATYFIWTNGTGKITAMIIISTGFISGAIWATLIWKKHGTIAWLSGIRRIS
jgi:hypothetical protein